MYSLIYKRIEEVNHKLAEDILKNSKSFLPLFKIIDSFEDKNFISHEVLKKVIVREAKYSEKTKKNIYIDKVLYKSCVILFFKKNNILIFHGDYDLCLECANYINDTIDGINTFPILFEFQYIKNLVQNLEYSVQEMSFNNITFFGEYLSSITLSFNSNSQIRNILKNISTNPNTVKIKVYYMDCSFVIIFKLSTGEIHIAETSGSVQVTHDFVSYIINLLEEA